MQETRVGSLGQEDPLEKGMATRSSILAWRIHQLNGQEFEQIPGGSEGQGSLTCCSPWGRKELDTTGRITAAQGLGSWVGGKNDHQKLGMGPMEAGLKPLTNAPIH